MKKNTNSNIEMDIGVKRRPFRNEKGEVLNDYETIKEALKTIDNYEKENGEPMPNMQPQFVQFCREFVKAVEDGTPANVYKKQHIVKMMPDYGIVCENTNKNNRR